MRIDWNRIRKINRYEFIVIPILEEEKLLDTEITEFESLEDAIDYLIQQEMDFEEKTENYIIAY